MGGYDNNAELSSPEWSLSHPPCCLPLSRTKWALVFARVIGLPSLITERSQNWPPSEDSNRLRPAFFAVKGKVLIALDRLAS
ncbi:hypothetical protein AVEN_36715-1, partial [Araneus ventricosus]